MCVWSGSLMKKKKARGVALKKPLVPLCPGVSLTESGHQSAAALNFLTTPASRQGQPSSNPNQHQVFPSTTTTIPFLSGQIYADLTILGPLRSLIVRFLDGTYTPSPIPRPFLVCAPARPLKSGLSRNETTHEPPFRTHNLPTLAIGADLCAPIVP